MSKKETISNSFQNMISKLNDCYPDERYYVLLDKLNRLELDKFKDEKDFEFEQQFVNVLFSKVIQTLEKYEKKLHSNCNNFRMIEYSMFKYIVDKFSSVVSPVFTIELLPKIFLSYIYIKVQFKERIKYYQYTFGVGFLELNENEFKDKEMTIKNNENELDFIPLKEMEF